MDWVNRKAYFSVFGGIAELYSHVLVCEVLHPSARFLQIMIAGGFILFLLMVTWL